MPRQNQVTFHERGYAGEGRGKRSSPRNSLSWSKRGRKHGTTGPRLPVGRRSGLERLRAVRHPGGNDPLRSGPKRECRIRDQDDIQKNTSDECSWGSGAVPLQRDGEDNECVDEVHPVTFPSDVSVRDASVSAMNAPTPGTAARPR